MNWKAKYQHQWEIANKREQRIIAYFVARGYTVETNGFEANSNKYNANHPLEKGIPDLLIKYKDHSFLMEVTGTVDLAPDSDIWIRPDKIDYALKHRNEQVFLAHLIDSLELIRFIYLSNIDHTKLLVINPFINGSTETFYSFKPEEFSTELFTDKLI